MLKWCDLGKAVVEARRGGMRMRSKVVLWAAAGEMCILTLRSDGACGGLNPMCGGLLLGTQGVPHGWQAWHSSGRVHG